MKSTTSSIYVVRKKIKRELLRNIPQLAGARNRLRAAYGELKGSSGYRAEPVILASETESETKGSGAFANSINPRVMLGAVGPKFEFAERAQKVPGKLEHFALRTRSTKMRDVFARSATSMQYDFADVVRILRALRAGKLSNSRVVKQWDAKRLLALARILSNQRLDETDLEDAEVIFNAMHRLHGGKALGKTDYYIYAETLTGLGKAGLAHRIFRDSASGKKDPVQAALLKANARALASEVDWESWAAAFNEVLARDGLSPISVTPNSGRSPFDSIHTTVEPRTVEGPKVTVFVPTFNRGILVETAIRSLVEQTWKNLEIIVIDDGSSSENREVLKVVCERYPEVKLILQPGNLGAYVARNTALKQATGEFVTVHDDDDWSHPEKIQVQVEHLLHNPECVGNIIYHVRATEDLGITRINNNPVFNQPYFGSLMYRTSVFEKYGEFDPINRSADAEFRDRVVAATGSPIPAVMSVPLAFIRAHGDSLTAGEISRGYIDPARTFYQSSYSYAFESKPDSIEWGAVEFARPLNMISPNRTKHLGTFDVIFATDFAFPGGTSQLTLKEIETAARAGLRVGMLLLASPLNAGKPAVTRLSTEVARLENVEVLTLDDRVDTPLLLVRHPSTMQFSESLSGNVNAEKVVVVVNHPPILSGGRGATYDLDDVRANVVSLFGREPEFRAESGVTLELTAGVAHRSLLSSALWPGFTELPVESGLTAPDFSKKPVVGRHSRDSKLKWPSTLNEIRSAYMRNETFDVAIMGGISSLPKPAQSALRENANVFEFNEFPVSDFLSGVDFWVYFHSDSLTESFGMSIIEAMAAGKVVVLPYYMQKNFGDGALYAKPSELKDLVNKYWEDPELYREQAARGRAKVFDMYSSRAFLERLAAFRR